MADLDVQPIVNFSTGIICPGAVGESQIPLTAVSESVNLNFNTIGAVTLRKGVTAVGSGLPGSSLGLYEFRDSGTGTNNRLVAVSGTALYYLSAGTWTSKRSGLTALSPARFTTFLDVLWMVNGTEATATWTGAVADSFITTGIVANAPKGQYIDNFRNRVWIAGNPTYPDRLYYSSAVSGTPPTIEWTESDVLAGHFDISPSDGDNITGIKRSKNTLLVFKRNHIYKVFSINETEPDPKIYVGTYSQESIVECMDTIYFHHPTGIYQLNDSGLTKISDAVKDYLNAMPSSAYTDVCGWTDGTCIYESIGTVTTNGVTYTNAVLVYNIFTKAWTVSSYPSQLYFSSNYDDGSTLYHLTSGSSSSVLAMDTGNTDNGTPITYSLITRPYLFDGLFSTNKRITKLSLIHNKMEGGIFTYRADTDDVNKWTHIAQVGKSASIYKTDIKGNKIWFRFQGSSTGEQFSLTGLEILKITSELIG